MSVDKKFKQNEELVLQLKKMDLKAQLRYFVESFYISNMKFQLMTSREVRTGIRKEKLFN